MTDLDYLKLSKPAKMAHDLGQSFASIPGRFAKSIKNLGLWFVKLFKGVGASIADLVTTFKEGDWKTKLSYLVMGFGSCARGQWGRGILFFLFQTVFNLYMFFPNASLSGCYYLGKLGTLGTVRFFVGEKSLQSEHPGYPEQGAQPTLPGGLHPSPESPGEAPLWPHWTHRTPLAAAPPAALAQLGLPGGTCGERWGCQLLTRRPCGLEGGLVTDTQGLCFLLSERMTLQPSSEGEVCPGLPRPGWEGSCCWEALGLVPLRADCERDAGAERVAI